MTDKKIVDDYYSQIKEDEVVSNEQEKPKVVAKRKIIIRKATKQNDDKNTTEQKEEPSINNQTKVEKKSKIVQKIEVVKKTEKVENTKVSNEKKENNHKFERKTATKVPVKKETGFVNVEASGGEVKWEVKNPRQNFKSKKTIDFETWEDQKKKFKLSQRQRTRWKVKFDIEDDLVFTRSNKLQKQKKVEKQVEDIKQNLVERKWETVVIPDFLSVKELSEKIWIILPKLIAEFMKNGMMVNINSKIDFETAAIISESFEIKLERDNSAWVNVEDIMLWDISSLLVEDDSSKLIPRSPVVSIMWHVDHWKTSLLDHIRKAKVAFWEAGGITQSIWAYQVELESWNITFLDTPWHEAFTIMRARWAKSTDIAILVVAADEWVKPQTIESISHAKEADIPVIVAINKMDKETANPDHVKWQLAEHWLVPEDWGWDTPMVPVSALTWFWVDDLLEIILLVAEMKELKANPDRNWVATVIESHLDHNLWPVATALINTWTIKAWDNIVCHDSYWKVKVLKNHLNQKVKYAQPGEPVLIVWLDKVVEWWDILQVVNTPEMAKTKASEYRAIIEKQKSSRSSWLEMLMSKIKSWNLKQLKIVLKADTNGSLEAIKIALHKLSTEETEIVIIHAWVWAITEWDILMWQWNDSILVWFWVWVLPTAKNILDSSDVEFISSDIIYHITEKIGKIITWMLDPKEVEIILWRSKVWWMFYTDRKFLILWLTVPPEAKVENNTNVRILRKKQMIWIWKIESLKEWTLEVKEVEWPKECWIKLVTWVKIEIWDELEVYKIEIQK